jgi:hypothetical protein
VPVFELLGGKQRDRVPAYANGWFVGAREPGEFGEKAAAAVAQGFRALKWDPFGSAYLTMDRQQRNRTVAIVNAVRAAVGPDVELMIEVHGRLNVPTAIAMAQELAPLPALLVRGAAAARIDRRAGGCAPREPGPDRHRRAHYAGTLTNIRPPEARVYYRRA